MATPLSQFDGFYWPPMIVLLYDHALTFDAEVRLVWRAPWNLAKYLFLTIRYSMPLIMGVILCTPIWLTLPPERQEAFMTIATMIPPAIADILLLLRLYAIWKRNTLILIVSLVIYAASYTVIIVLTALAFAQFLKLDREPWFVDPFALLIPARACTFAFDMWALIMTLIKAVKYARIQHMRSTLLYIIYRDGILYYVAIIVIKLFVLVVSSRPQHTTFQVVPWDDNFLMSPALTVAFTTRMFLNLRDVRTEAEWSAATSFRKPPNSDNSEFQLTEWSQPEPQLDSGWQSEPWKP
ncbi:hypothetical protein BOTBODRAFT_186563 [Botryobasidium botryosum FD-172 SS1]|uniref:DUF6533 domain-containing protein n=1 Tax=Botryobasidium botryosum (strain FD-172 SS1) TaxID=930990 RepID=A0A067MLC0_BOTB1|nr:hypothetical protein BOTBODRAFT_186563 [Botryobasidium botryosum FD-172 SS1]